MEGQKNNFGWGVGEIIALKNIFKLRNKFLKSRTRREIEVEGKMCVGFFDRRKA
jgi:hypothetical protein